MNSQGNTWTCIDVSSTWDQKTECNFQITDVIPATEMFLKTWRSIFSLQHECTHWYIRLK